MPNYRRFYLGNIWFLTVVAYARLSFLNPDNARQILRRAIIECKKKYPFNIEARVLLSDHLHCLWELPNNDLNYSRRWAITKPKFTQIFKLIWGESVEIPEGIGQE